VSDLRGMLNFDNNITRKDNKDGLLSQTSIYCSLDMDKRDIFLLRRLYLVPSNLAMSGFSVFKGAAQLLASLPFSHRPPQPEGESVGAMPSPIFNSNTISCSVVGQNPYLGDSKQNYKHENTGAGLSYRVIGIFAVPAATGLSRQHRSRSTWGLVSRSIE
jgi:hypothetical protein